MKEEELDAVLVPFGVVILCIYHVWLLYTIKHNPRHTVIGLNKETHHQWVLSLMADPLKNGILTVQTLRNGMMASTLLATTAITLSSIIGIFVTSTSDLTNTTSMLIYGNKTSLVASVKYFTLIFCFLVAFLCNVESLRYYGHISFLATLPTSQGNVEAMEYAARSLHRASLFWSFGLRAFYLSFVLFLWIFGPIPMLVCSCVMTGALYFLDTTTSYTRQIHCDSLKENDSNGVELSATLLAHDV